jgi:hypothetical protein
MDSENFIAINSLHDNGGLAIDILPNGPSPSGGPAGFNVPVITSQTSDGTNITINFTHDAAAITGYRGLFFRNATADPSGYGEAETYLGNFTWATNASGHFEGSASFPIPAAGALPGTAAASTFVYTIVTCTNPGSLVFVTTTEANLAFPVGVTPPPVAETSETTGSNDHALHASDPVNTFSGELFDLESVDLNLRGPMPLFFARYYASKLESDAAITSALGREPAPQL